ARASSSEMRARVLLTALVALLSLTASAAAEPVQEFNVQIKDARADGRYTIVFSSNSYDTSGEQPPLVTSNSVRFAKGVQIRKEFLNSRYRCDVPRLRDVLTGYEEPTP